MENHPLQRATRQSQVDNLMRNIAMNGFVKTQFLTGFVKEGYALPDLIESSDLTHLDIKVQITKGGHCLGSCVQLMAECPEEYLDMVVMVLILSNGQSCLLPT